MTATTRELNITIAGEAGQGLVTVGKALAKAAVRAGRHVCITQGYESRIRGGHDVFAVRICADAVALVPHGKEGVTGVPFGELAPARNANAVALSVAAYLAGLEAHLAGLIVRALRYPGFALVDILRPCVSFNKTNTFEWFNNRCRPLADDYDAMDFDLALKTAFTWGDVIPVGVIYDVVRPHFEDRFPATRAGALGTQLVKVAALDEIIASYG